MYFTEKQLRILEFIQKYRTAKGISPTMEEIADEFAVTKITIYEHVNELARKGALKKEKFKARSIELLIPVEERTERMVLPLLGGIQSGAPIQNGQEERTLDLSTVLPLSKECFALLVRDNSLIEDQIRHGDYVIVERRDQPQNGETVVVVLPDGRAALRRFFRGKSRIRLSTSNGRTKSTYPRKVEILGVVIGLLRNFTPERN
jgi:repressor LexA